MSRKPKQPFGTKKWFCWFTIIYGHILQNFIEMNYDILIGRRILERCVLKKYPVFHAKKLKQSLSTLE